MIFLDCFIFQVNQTYLFHSINLHKIVNTPSCSLSAVGALKADPISSGYKKQHSNFINSQTCRYMLFNITLSLGTAAKHMLTPFVHSHVCNPWPSQMVPSANQCKTTESVTHCAQPKMENIKTRCISNKPMISGTNGKMTDLSRVNAHAILITLCYVLCDIYLNKKPSRKTTALSGHCAQVSARKYQFRSLEDHLVTIIANSNRTGYSHKFFDKLTKSANPGAKSSMQVYCALEIVEPWYTLNHVNTQYLLKYPLSRQQVRSFTSTDRWKKSVVCACQDTTFIALDKA